MIRRLTSGFVGFEPKRFVTTGINIFNDFPAGTTNHDFNIPIGKLGLLESWGFCMVVTTALAAGQKAEVTAEAGGSLLGGWIEIGSAIGSNGGAQGFGGLLVEGNLIRMRVVVDAGAGVIRVRGGALILTFDR